MLQTDFMLLLITQSILQLMFPCKAAALATLWDAALDFSKQNASDSIQFWSELQKK